MTTYSAALRVFRGNMTSARSKAELSVDEAARRCGVSRATWYAWECGRNVPTIPKLLDAAEVLGTTAAKLMKGC